MEILADGTYRQFGPMGPVYQIIKVGPHDPLQGWVVVIEIPQSGARLEYLLKDALGDPEAQ